jgi:hypothetical protein
MSPDKKWFWDGAAWRPIPVHEAAFPNWKGIGAGFTPEMAAQPAPAVPQTPRFQPPPAPAYRMAGPAPDVVAPRWSSPPTPQTKVRKYGIVAGGVGVLIAVVALVSILATLALSNRQAPAPKIATTKPQAGPANRSDTARADYVLKALTAPMADLKDTASTTRTTCAVGMTSSCADTFIAIDNSVTAMVTVLDGATIPLCIAAQETKLRADLGALAAGEQLGYKGFHDNKKSEFASGLAQVNSVSARVQTDFAAVAAAAPGCDSALTGP